MINLGHDATVRARFVAAWAVALLRGISFQSAYELLFKGWADDVFDLRMHDDLLASSAARLARLLAEHTGRPWTAEHVLAHKYTSRTLAMFNIPIKFGFLHLDQRTGVSP